MKKILLLFFTFLLLKSEAQITAIFADEFPDSAKARIGITADYDLGSNNLTNEFSSIYYRGGYINNALKDEVLGRTKNKNRVGANLNYGIYAAFKLDSLFHKKDISLFFSIKNREHFDAAFSKDLYKTGFYGNALNAGKTAYFDGFSTSLLRYQQLQLGLFFTKIDSAARFGIAFSFLKGEQYESVYAKTASLYTSADGQYLDFNTSITAARSDTSKKGYGAFNGYGASADLYFEAPFKGRLGDSKITISVSDIGLLRFNQNSLYLSQDSTFHFEGYQINNLHDLENAVITDSFSQDSIGKNKNGALKKQNVSVTLPAVLDFSFQTKISKNFVLHEGIHYMFNANYKLLAYIKAEVYFSPRLMLAASFSYGGYSNFNYGLGLFANLGKGFIIYAGSRNVEGFILPKKTTAQGAYISLIKNFK